MKNYNCLSLSILILLLFILNLNAENIIPNLIEPITVSYVDYYKDGGTLGITLLDSNKKELKCFIDGRMRTETRNQLYLNSHPSEKETLLLKQGSIEEKKIIDILIKLLNDKNPKIRATTAKALGKLKTKRATKYLNTKITDTNEIASSNIIWAIGEIGDTTSVEYLAKALKTVGHTKKINIIMALGKIGDVKSQEILNNMKNKSSGTELELIEDTLNKIKK